MLSSSASSSSSAASAAPAPARKRPRDSGSDGSSCTTVAPPLAAPFRGPAADAPLGELLLDVLPIAFHHGHALELHRMRGLCGLTLRERAAPGGAVTTPYGVGELLERRAADGVRVVRMPWATLYTRERVDERGYRGGAADAMARALEAQAPWLRAARGMPREQMVIREWFGAAVNRTTSLMRAADAGDERRVRELLAAGAPLCCVDDKWQMTALHRACLKGNARVVAALLEADAAGTTVVARDMNRRTPLFLASMRGHEGVLRVLLENGARQELQSEQGMLALHDAASRGHTSIIELLCAEPGAPVDAQNTDGHTALIIASTNGNVHAVRTLLACGARLGPRQSKDGWTALHCAAACQHTAVVELLCAAPDAQLDVRDRAGRTPLWLVSDSHYECTGAVWALIARGALQELQDENGRAALHQAAENGHTGVVELLCAAPGAAQALALQDSKGHTPLASLSHPPAPFYPATKAGQDACAAVMRAHGAS